MKRLCMGLCIIGLIALLPVIASAQQCSLVDIEVTAEISTDPGYEGLYKYTISGSWEVNGRGGVSHLLFSLGAECPCLCDSSSSAIYFPGIAGTSTGMNILEEPCEATYIGFFECNGQQETDDIVLKYEVYTTECDPTESGTGTWIFYSTIPPLQWAEYPDAVYVKYDHALCMGTLRGQLPNCYECMPVSTEHDSWGSLKSLYR